MEIGGYLEFEHYFGQEYHTDCIKLNTARNALKYLIEARDIKKIWLPKWNCSAILETCKEQGLEVGFFDLDEAFLPVLPSEYQPSDYVYVVNYYDQLPGIHIDHLIMDNVQAFFHKPQKGIDTIYTCRKYFGVPDGAYLYTEAKINRVLKQDCSYGRLDHLTGRLECSGAEFYNQYLNNEQNIDNLEMMKMSKYTENILKSIDYELVRKKRETNFCCLHERLKDINLLNIQKPVGPFAYPLLIHNGAEIRKKMQEKKVYIAKLWPNVLSGREGYWAENILPLPCDQRYGEEEMNYIANCLIEERIW